MSIEKKSQLSEKQLTILESEMEKHKKSVGVAYVLLIFLGSLGAHKFYLSKIMWGIIYIVLGVLGWITLLTGGVAALADDTSSASGLVTFGLLCSIVLGIFILYDLITLPKQVKKLYEKEEEKIIDKLLSSSNNQSMIG